MTTSGGETLSRKVKIPAQGRLEDAFTWTPRHAETYTLKVSVPVAPGELDPDNNEAEVEINVRKESLQVLVVESFPRWEYRYLRNALMRDPGIEVSCLLFHPDLEAHGGGRSYISSFPGSTEELAKYDVVFLGDIGVKQGQLNEEQCRLLKGLVEQQASGLVFLPGFRGNQLTLMESELEDLYPVVLDPGRPRGTGSPIAYTITLTGAGRQSLLTKLAPSPEENATVWNRLPGFHWYAPVVRARAGSEVLAVHTEEAGPEGRLPLLATRRFGTGKVLFLGTDGAWRWREGVEDLYHYRFWGQVVRWMAYQRNMARGEGLRLWHIPERPEPAQRIAVYANAMDQHGAPLAQGPLIARITSPSGERTRIRLDSSGEEWGLFTTDFTPVEAGVHQVMLTSPHTDETLETTIQVAGQAIEQVGKPARFDVLREIAQVTRGKFVTSTSELEKLIKTLSAMPSPKPITRRFQLWSSPYWAGLVILLMSVFWVGRKLTGTL